jgi:anti-sigma regulatory factor (Ser/Thr protein kinase)
MRGQERVAIRQVTQAVAPLNLPTQRLKRLQTAVAEATMNALEHGNRYRMDALVAIQVLADSAVLIVRIMDEGSTPFTLQTESPDLAAKLEGRQTKRGLGLVLMHHMVDQVHLHTSAGRHTVELILQLDKEGSDVSRTI